MTTITTLVLGSYDNGNPCLLPIAIDDDTCVGATIFMVIGKRAQTSQYLLRLLPDFRPPMVVMYLADEDTQAHAYQDRFSSLFGAFPAHPLVVVTNSTLIRDCLAEGGMPVYAVMLEEEGGVVFFDKGKEIRLT
ncbi:MAG TPA: hypothetical protein VFO38_02225 [Candidatus Saccharimonadales bacterium]|nr:hypothetical protein [Candidatus Saccharimonadales bacterium]